MIELFEAFEASDTPIHANAPKGKPYYRIGLKKGDWVLMRQSVFEMCGQTLHSPTQLELYLRVDGDVHKLLVLNTTYSPMSKQEIAFQVGSEVYNTIYDMLLNIERPKYGLGNIERTITWKTEITFYRLVCFLKALKFIEASDLKILTIRDVSTKIDNYLKRHTNLDTTTTFDLDGVLKGVRLMVDTGVPSRRRVSVRHNDWPEGVTVPINTMVRKVAQTTRLSEVIQVAIKEKTRILNLGTSIPTLGDVFYS